MDRIWLLTVLSLVLVLVSACERARHDPSPPGAEFESDEHNRRPGDQLVDRYVAAYDKKMLDESVALYAPDARVFLYPAREIAAGRDALRETLGAEFAEQPYTKLVLPYRYQTGEHQWVALGRALSGTDIKPLVMVFDLNSRDDAINALWTLIGAPPITTGPTGPSAAMTQRWNDLLSALQSDSLPSPGTVFADTVQMFVYPPKGEAIPLAARPGDVSGILAYKWGAGAFSKEGAPRDDMLISRFMQFVVAAIPREEEQPRGNPASDRVILFTFGTDKDAASFEKIIRVDIIGQG